MHVCAATWKHRIFLDIPRIFCYPDSMDEKIDIHNPQVSDTHGGKAIQGEISLVELAKIPMDVNMTLQFRYPDKPIETTPEFFDGKTPAEPLKQGENGCPKNKNNRDAQTCASDF